MTIYGASWGMGLQVDNPLAKLLAIALGDCCDAEGGGCSKLIALAQWCGTSEKELLSALTILKMSEDVHWGQYGDEIQYRLPTGALAKRPSSTASPGLLTLYVISGRVGVKVGITGSLEQRVDGLRVSLIDDTVTAVWSAEDFAPLIRRAEMRAHSKLAANRIRYEWFNCTAEQAIAAAKAALEEIRNQPL